MNQNDPGETNKVNEISIFDIVDNLKAIAKYLKSKWIMILVITLIGGITGFFYSILKKTKYSAICTFVLDDARAGNAGQYGGLTSLIGINLGGGGGGIFEGDNILELYKSRAMIEKTLLNACVFNGKKQLLIDRLIEDNNKDDDVKNPVKISFAGDANDFNRKQDSVITDLVGEINSKILNVTKPDKRLNIISVEVITKDELFSKCFNEKLVQTVNEFYVETKTKKSFQNVQILAHQLDSVKMILNHSISGVASANDSAPNANPLMSTLRVSSQKKQVDVQANAAIYNQMVQNLELGRISLRQDMPLIQVIDKPVLPLFKVQTRPSKAITVGAFLFGFLTVLFFSMKQIIKTVFNRNSYRV